MQALIRTMQFPPEVPLHLTRIEIEIAYRTQAVADGWPADRAGELSRVAAHLAGLLRAGFLCRPSGPDDSARVGVRQSGPDRVMIGYAGRGAHVNLLVLLLRLVHRYHQTPPEVEANLRAAAADPAEVASYFTPLVFADLIAAVAARQLVAAPGSPMRATPDGTRALSQDMPVPGSGPLSPDPVVEAELLRATGVPAPDEDVADHWLSVSQFAAFLPPGHDPAHEPGDEAFHAEGKALEIEAIGVEQVFLFELLAVLSGGRMAQVRVTEG